jgi:hypothetical protein
VPPTRKRTTAAALVATLAGVLWLALVGTASALLAPSLVLDPPTAQPGVLVRATGSGFQPRGSVRLYLGGVSPGAELAVVALSGGGFSTSFNAPGAAGAYQVIACYEPDGSGGCREQARSSLRVVDPPPSTPSTLPPPPPTPPPSPTTTLPGQIVDRAPTTTRPDGSITTGGSTTSTTEPDQPDSSTSTDTTESSTSSSTATTAGDGSNRRGLGLDQPSAAPGGRVTVSGTGCPPNQPVALSMAGRRLHPTTADDQGSFTTAVEVPPIDVGRHQVTARCGRTLTAPLDVVLVSSVRPPTSTLAVLVFFVLLLVGAARRFLGTGASPHA